MRLLAFEIMITNDLVFSEGLAQLMDVPFDPGYSESMAVRDGVMIGVAVWCG